MRKIIVSLLVVSALGLSACASFGKKPPKPTPQTSEESAPTPSTDNSGIEKIDHSSLPPPRKQGFFSKLSKKMGADSETANVGPCPAVKIVYDSSRFVDISGDNKFENVGYTGEMQNVSANCRYVGSDPITMNLVIDMALGKGPKAQGEFKDVKYWVAVTRKDIAPIAKREFTGRVYFKPNEDRTRFLTPQATITIPRANSEVSGANFEVLVGFELSDEQLAFNRNGIRFKVNAGEK